MERDFDGCRRACRTRGRHTLRYAECEYAERPEPTVTMTKVVPGPDGGMVIGYDQYTVESLADLIEPALRRVVVRLGPVAEAADLAREAAHAIVHRNEEGAEQPAKADDTLHTCPGRWGGPNCVCFDAPAAQAGRDQRAVARVRALHRPYRFAGDDSTDYCAHCNQISGGWVPWRCPTIAALDGEQPGPREAP